MFKKNITLKNYFQNRFPPNGNTKNLLVFRDIQSPNEGVDDGGFYKTLVENLVVFKSPRLIGSLQRSREILAAKKTLLTAVPSLTNLAGNCLQIDIKK